MPKAGSIGGPRGRADGRGRSQALQAELQPPNLGFHHRPRWQERGGRGVVVITSVVKRSQANQGIDEPSLLIFNSSQLQEVGKKEVLNDCFPTALTYVHVQFQRADPYIMH